MMAQTAQPLPTELSRPMLVGDRVAAKVMLDLTVYLIGPDVQEFDAIVASYEALCPSHRFLRYRTTELEYWSSVKRPDLTESGRQAAARGGRWPFFEPVRLRIEANRAFDAQIWDGKSIEHPQGSWSLSIRAVKRRSSGVHAFVRVLMPVDTDHEVIWSFAVNLCRKARILSGHGGLTFVYDPWMKEQIFDEIYALARRFWNVDIEDLNSTLVLMRHHIKGVFWLTIIGDALAMKYRISPAHLLAVLSTLVRVERSPSAVLAQLGPHPTPEDVARGNPVANTYLDVSQALAAMHLQWHPDFPGARFSLNGNTTGWIRRHLEPYGWRG